MKWFDNLIEYIFHAKAKKEIDEKFEFIKKTSEQTIRVCDTALRCIELQVSYADRFRDPRYTISIFKEGDGETVYRADLSTDSRKMSFAFTQHGSFIHVWRLDDYIKKEELEDIKGYSSHLISRWRSNIECIYYGDTGGFFKAVRHEFGQVKLNKKRVLELIK